MSAKLDLHPGTCARCASAHRRASPHWSYSLLTRATLLHTLVGILLLVLHFGVDKRDEAAWSEPPPCLPPWCLFDSLTPVVAALCRDRSSAMSMILIAVASFGVRRNDIHSLASRACSCPHACALHTVDDHVRGAAGLPGALHALLAAARRDAHHQQRLPPAGPWPPTPFANLLALIGVSVVSGSLMPPARYATPTSTINAPRCSQTSRRRASASTWRRLPASRRCGWQGRSRSRTASFRRSAMCTSRRMPARTHGSAKRMSAPTTAPRPPRAATSATRLTAA